MKKIDRMRATFLKIGLLISLGAVFLAFNYTIYQDDVSTAGHDLDQIEEPFEMIRTTHPEKKKAPPPPKPKPVDPKEIDDFDDIEYMNEPIEDLEFDSMMFIEPIYETGKSNHDSTTAVVAVVVEPPQPDDKVYSTFQVEKMPSMGDCNHLKNEERSQCTEAAFYNFVASRIRYPAVARENGIEGMVHVQFVIGKTGEIEKISILRDIGGGCGAEVDRVMKLLPKWTPGIQCGRPVKVAYTAPVKFSLE